MCLIGFINDLINQADYVEHVRLQVMFSLGFYEWVLSFECICVWVLCVYVCVYFIACACSCACMSMCASANG